MNHRRPFGRKDDIGMSAGDNVFLGVNLKLDPSRLPPGYASAAINMRFRDGVAQTRHGSIIAPWLNKISGANVQPWSAIYGVGVFRDPTTFIEYVIIAAEGAVYLCLENNAPRSLPLPAGVTITTRVRFVQCFNVVVMLRGFNDAPLVMSDINEGWKAILQTASGTGTLAIPNCERGVFVGNRLFVARNDDTIVASDIGDYTRFTLFNDFKINQGDADKVVELATFGESSIIVLKQRSVYRVDSVYGDLLAISLSKVTGRYGCVAADSVVDCGSDLLWLSQEGVASLTLTTLNEVQAGQGAASGKQRMFSEDIGPLIDRIHWNYAENACAVLWNDRYYLGVPLDAAETRGTELAYLQDTNGVGVLTIGDLVVGQTYRWTRGSGLGAFTTTLACGAFSSTVNTTFTATATTATITVSDPDNYTIPDTFHRVFIGANTALLHYDFQNAAWGGYDEGENLTFTRCFITTYLGRQRLFVLDAAGYARLWEEGYADRAAEPYAEVTVATTPAVGNTLRVNAGDTVTAFNSPTNSGLNWGCQNLAAAQQNIWASSGSTGYSLSATTPWTAPNTRRYRIATTFAVRFYGFGGVLPTVTTTGSWATISYVVEQEIQSTLTTRAYTDDSGGRIKVNRAEMDLQTWNPSLTLSLIGDGVNETETITGTTAITRSRTAYARLGTTAWDPTNVNADHGNPYREDYSILQTGTSWAITLGAAGVRTDLHQEARYAYPANLECRAARISLASTQGRVRVMQCRVEKTDLGTPAGVSV